MGDIRMATKNREKTTQNIDKKYANYRKVLLENMEHLEITERMTVKQKRFDAVANNDTIEKAVEQLGESSEVIFSYLRNMVYEIKKNSNTVIGGHIGDKKVPTFTIGNVSVSKSEVAMSDIEKFSISENIEKSEQSTTPIQDRKIPISENLQNIAQTMTSYIPQQDGYISQRMLGSSDTLILQKLYENKNFVLIEGPTGTGKSHLARELAYSNQVPYMRVNLNGATVPEDLIGQWIPNANPNVNAKYVWNDGVLTMFMRYGGIFVVDEINMAPADILSLFHSITDDERRLVLTNKDGEVIHAHPNFFLIATMNRGYEGTKPLNLALKDRFRIFEMSYNEITERKLKIPEEMLSVASKLRDSVNIFTPVSTRDLLKYTQDCKIFPEKISREFFINNFDTDEKPAVREIISLIMDFNDKKDNDTYTDSDSA